MTTDSHAAPFSAPARPELTGGRRIAVVLSHGFTGSPASMRPWAEALAERGYGVELPLLPGHGTTWQQMNGTTWDDWYAQVTGAFEKALGENDAVAACGLSMGGGLVLRLAADHPDRVAAVVVVNPMVITRRKDVLALPVLKWLVPSFPGITNDIKKPGVEEHGYTRTPLKAADSMFRAGRVLARDLHRITAPLLVFHSEEDHVVDDATVPLIAERVSSTDVTERTLRESYHVATLDNDAPQIFEESAAFIARATA
ncbi:alpha/beta hydrolase [Nocardioides sp.]|uniref:alpha/beta hydrolase n=1 Tax=Nocardioides sp. TaxID=35761 RepID=UPI002D7EDC04|nr:alpha/beta fold hydrolase [Nocardioides sp.]HET8960270.1 alpha/beta fold hydrolase [Nocardioides sp.]